MSFCHQICQWDLTSFSEHFDSLSNITDKHGSIKPECVIINRTSNSLHFLHFLIASHCRIQKVEFIKRPNHLIRFLSHFYIAQKHCGLSQFQEIVLFFQLLSSFESYLNVSTCQGQIKSLLNITFEEQSDFRVSLFLQVGDYGMSAQIALGKNLFHLV